MSERKDLLPSDAIAGIRLGISVSESPDLLRLGLLEAHFRLALGEIARCVLVSGGQLAYGGHLQPDGYTAFLIRELERYSRRDRPMKVSLAWTEHRKMALSALDSETHRLGLYGEIVCLDLDGNAIDPAAGRDEAPPPPVERCNTAAWSHRAAPIYGSPYEWPRFNRRPSGWLSRRDAWSTRRGNIFLRPGPAPLSRWRLRRHDVGHCTTTRD